MYKYYLELPENYKLDKTIDMKKMSTNIFLNVINILFVIISFLILIPLKFKEIKFDNLIELSIVMFIALIGFIIYIVLHELTHGLFYKIFTKQKLTFGVSLTYAYCGVPNIYVRKKEAIIACLSPLIIFSIIFLTLIFILPPNYINLSIIILFSFHFGGCSGDIFLSLILLIKYDKDTYIKDTGPTQYIYKKGE